MGLYHEENGEVKGFPLGNMEDGSGESLTPLCPAPPGTSPQGEELGNSGDCRVAGAPRNDAMKMERPGYYAVIPAEVRYDDAIPPNAKLLYGEISAMVDSSGRCIADNAYFSALYQLSDRTVTSLIKALKDGGYIDTVSVRNPDGKGTTRIIRLNVFAVGGHGVENNFYPPRKYFLPPLEKNCGSSGGDTISINNNITTGKKEKEKINKKEKERKENSFDPLPQVIAWIGATFPEESRESKNRLYQAFVRFNENRIALKKPYNTSGGVTALTNKLMRFSKVDLEKMIELLDDAVDNKWQSVYPREQKQPDKPKHKGRVYECL